MSERYPAIPLQDADVQCCWSYALLMQQGRIGMKNVKYEDADSIHTYMAGKLGEWAFSRWLNARTLFAAHTPFRFSYAELDPLDDFYLYPETSGIQVEVKLKSRQVPPRDTLDHCTDRILDGRVYVFVDHERDRGARRDARGWEDYRGVLRLAGWTTTERLHDPDITYFVPKGTAQRAPDGTVNFVSRRDEYNIKIGQLYPMATLADLLHEARDREAEHWRAVLRAQGDPCVAPA